MEPGALNRYSPIIERVYPMSIQEVSAEQLAELFHHYHQALAPDFGL